MAIVKAKHPKTGKPFRYDSTKGSFEQALSKFDAIEQEQSQQALSDFKAKMDAYEAQQQPEQPQEVATSQPEPLTDAQAKFSLMSLLPMMSSAFARERMGKVGLGALPTPEEFISGAAKGLTLGVSKPVSEFAMEKAGEATGLSPERAQRIVQAGEVDPSALGQVAGAMHPAGAPMKLFQAVKAPFTAGKAALPTGAVGGALKGLMEVLGGATAGGTESVVQQLVEKGIPKDTRETGDIALSSLLGAALGGAAASPELIKFGAQQGSKIVKPVMQRAAQETRIQDLTKALRGQTEKFQSTLGDLSGSELGQSLKDTFQSMEDLSKKALFNAKSKVMGGPQVELNPYRTKKLIMDSLESMGAKVEYPKGPALPGQSALPTVKLPTHRVTMTVAGKEKVVSPQEMKELVKIHSELSDPRNLTLSKVDALRSEYGKIMFDVAGAPKAAEVIKPIVYKGIRQDIMTKAGQVGGKDAQDLLDAAYKASSASMKTQNELAKALSKTMTPKKLKDLSAQDVYDTVIRKFGKDPDALLKLKEANPELIGKFASESVNSTLTKVLEPGKLSLIRLRNALDNKFKIGTNMDSLKRTLPDDQYKELKGFYDTMNKALGEGMESVAMNDEAAKNIWTHVVKEGAKGAGTLGRTAKMLKALVDRGSENEKTLRSLDDFLKATEKRMPKVRGALEKAVVGGREVDYLLF